MLLRQERALLLQLGRLPRGLQLLQRAGGEFFLEGSGQDYGFGPGLTTSLVFYHGVRLFIERAERV